MKKVIMSATLLALLGVGVACTENEETVPVSDLDSENLVRGFAEGIAAGLGDLHLDDPVVFTYTTEQEKDSIMDMIIHEAAMVDVDSRTDADGTVHSEEFTVDIRQNPTAKTITVTPHSTEGTGL
jgi:hypothetical protein